MEFYISDISIMMQMADWIISKQSESVFKTLAEKPDNDRPCLVNFTALSPAHTCTFADKKIGRYFF